MINSNIYGIFPTPIYICRLNKKISTPEFKFVEENKKKCYPNQGNSTSNNKYVLNETPFINIKKELDLIIKDYFNKIEGSGDSVKPYITQSWLNYTEKNQHHHRHSHENSIVSGVLYIKANKEFDKIKFFKNRYKQIAPEIINYNLWNAESYWFSVETGDVVMFPSYLDHMVEVTEKNETRISLAFNVFIKGDIGNSEKLTQLRL
tara:strand:+ start:733 stop:1347 length:615 start_codon:yes stop_codon:yes gene_type:complete